MATRRNTLIASVAVVSSLTWIIHRASASCEFRKLGSLPSPGLCSGPVGRAIALRDGWNIMNWGCELSQTPLNVDGDWRCGECVPGSSGNSVYTPSHAPYTLPATLEKEICTFEHGKVQCTRIADSGLNASSHCGLNEYCDQEGRCRPIKESPLYRAECFIPDDQPADSSALLCGPGLSCIQGQCRICTPDRNSIASMTYWFDSPDPQMGWCVNDEYTRNKWQTLSSRPSMVCTVCILSLAVAYAVKGVILGGQIIAKHAEGRKIRRLEEQYKAIPMMDVSE